MGWRGCVGGRIGLSDLSQWRRKSGVRLAQGIFSGIERSEEMNFEWLFLSEEGGVGDVVCEARLSEGVVGIASGCLVGEVGFVKVLTYLSAAFIFIFMQVPGSVPL